MYQKMQKIMTARACTSVCGRYSIGCSYRGINVRGDDAEIGLDDRRVSFRVLIL